MRQFIRCTRDASKFFSFSSFSRLSSVREKEIIGREKKKKERNKINFKRKICANYETSLKFRCVIFRVNWWTRDIITEKALKRGRRKKHKFRMENSFSPIYCYKSYSFCFLDLSLLFRVLFRLSTLNTPSPASSFSKPPHKHLRNVELTVFGRRRSVEKQESEKERGNECLGRGEKKTT